MRWRTGGGWGTLLGLAVAVRAGVVLNRSLDPDESQHLHAAWMVSQGQVPFLDFWEHHSPLLYYFLAPLTRLFAESPAVYFAGRVAMLLPAGVALLLAYRLARRVSVRAAMAGVALLAFLPEFVEHTTEVRPDVPALAAWLGSLLALTRRREGGAAGWSWASGACLGLALALTPKAAVGAVGLAVAVVTTAGGRGRWSAGRSVTDLARLGLGAAVPLGAMLGWLGLTGGAPALSGFVQQVILQNLRFVDFSKTWPVSPAGLGFGLLALAGLAATLRDRGPGVVRHPLHGVLLPPLFTIAALLESPWTPAVYRQAWLPVLAIGATYAGAALAQVLRWAGSHEAPVRRVAAIVVLAGALVPPFAQSVALAVRNQNRDQLRLARRLLTLACPGEAVLDGTALAVFRPPAHRYGVLITGVREWIARGVIAEEEIEADLLRTRPRVAHVDRRLRGLVGVVQSFVERYYVATGDELRLAGASVAVPGGPAGGRAYVDLLVPGPYRVTRDPGIAAMLDGVLLRPGWVELEAGRHEATWTGGPGRITLISATCPERRAGATGSNRLTVP